MIPDTSKFIVTQEFDRLTKMKLYGRIAEIPKNLENKKEAENSLDLGDQKREKVKKLQAFVLSYLIGKSCFDNKNYLTFEPVFKVLLIKC